MAKVVRAVDSKIGETRFSSPFILPGRETALIAVGSTTGNLIASGVRRIGRAQTRQPTGPLPRYLPEGFLVFVRGASLLAAPFDASTGSLSGAAEPFVDDVRTEIGTGMAQFAFSNTECSSTPPAATCRPARSDGLTVAARSTRCPSRLESMALPGYRRTEGCWQRSSFPALNPTSGSTTWRPSDFNGSRPTAQRAQSGLQTVGGSRSGPAHLEPTRSS